MSAAAGAAAASASTAAAIANAIKASGVLVTVEAEAFREILYRAEAPLVVHARTGYLSKRYQYLTSYRGLAFYTKTERPLNLPVAAEVVLAKKLSIPG